HPAHAASSPLSLHDALPISLLRHQVEKSGRVEPARFRELRDVGVAVATSRLVLGAALDVEQLLIIEHQKLRGLVRRDSGVDSGLDRKSTRLNSSHVKISYAV